MSNNNKTINSILGAVAALTVLALAPPVSADVVPVDVTSPANGITDIFSATFDGALSPCTGSDPSWCSFFNGKPGPNRNIVITPDPTGVINGVPLGITPTPTAGSYLDLTVDGARTQVTIAGGTIAVPPISLVIQGGTPNSTVVNASGAGVVFESAPRVATLDANGRAEFLVNTAPTLAVDFSTFSVIVGAPNGSCAGPLCAIIPILTLDMVKYRLVIDYDPTFTFFTADFIGQTGNNSILSLTMNSAAPEITVTDTVAPADNLVVAFGDVTTTITDSESVTVTNSGGVPLALGTVGLVAVLDPPFAVATDNCSGATLLPSTSCTIGVTFTPDTEGPVSDTFDIPSNDVDEPSVTVTLTGNGTIVSVPNITVSDSVTPTTDASVPFGSHELGTTIDESVTVTNDGTADLVIGSVASLVALDAPFSIFADTCSGLTLAPTLSCTVGVRFQPTSVGAFPDTFDIPSNDAADPTITVSVSGTGTFAEPEITVTDNTLPADDLSVPFGNVTLGTTRDLTVTITNSGGMDLLLGVIGTTQPLGAPFTIVSDPCSGQAVASGASCIVTVRYTPTTTDDSSDSFDIPSNDANETSVTVLFSGAGIEEGEGGVVTPSPSGADSGFMAVDPLTLLGLGGIAAMAFARRRRH